MNSTASRRWKREECRRTKHESVFSAWKVLIGPSDWEDYSLGRDGVERYRIQNLPANCSCPGLYELGIAISSHDGHKTRRHTLGDVVVLYLGEADNVRTRLQEYGRAGSHLDHGISFTFKNKTGSPCIQTGPGFFKDVFLRGYSIVYRWTPMSSKREAEKMEAKLLNFFDYAWNRRGNGACRHEDILLKLDNTSTSSTAIFRMLQQWKQPLFSRKIGIKICEGLPFDDVESSSNRSIIPKIFKFMKSQPRVVEQNDNLYEGHEVCGVAIGHGRICRNKPVARRKRCPEHKGKKITGFSSVPNQEVLVSENTFFIASTHLDDGFACLKFPNEGRKESDLHESETILRTKDHMLSDSRLQSPIKTDSSTVQITSSVDKGHDVCGVVLGDGSTCLKQPPSGRKRCKLHKGMRVVTRASCPVKGIYKLNVDYEACGVALSDGSGCMNRPVSGGKRCELHRGQKVTEANSITGSESSLDKMYKLDDKHNISGAITGDGEACSRCPAPGRCEEHEGHRIFGSGSIKNIDILTDRGTSFVCGVTIANGSVCMNSPAPGRKRCTMHKGRRVR